MRRRNLSPEETAIWDRVTRTVRAYPGRTIPKTSGAQSVPPAAPADATVSPKPTRQPPKPAPTPPKLPPAPPADASNHKRVRRGALDIDGRLDLHGMNQEQARQALQSLLARLQSQNGRCALIITGKGRPDAQIDDYYAPPPGILRRRLPEWLADPSIRPMVAGWSPAHPRHGGGGAFYVLIKRKTN